MSLKAVPALAALALIAPFCGPAAAQSVGAPAGREPATAPGGTEGLAGPRNESEAIRAGDAVPVTPGRGIPVEAPPAEPVAPPPPRN
ncbi:hypothetical protein [Methylobacterium sp. A54F]